MATSLLALLDDITSVLDDVATLTKVATKKTAGVLGDDLALNANQVSGVRAARELPVVWAVAKGSLRNKAILVPAALIISALAPWAITPLLMVGGLYLCFEAAEKLADRFLHSGAEADAERARLIEALVDPTVDLVEVERDKIKGAIRTDFILSAEIVVITLGAVADASALTRVGVLTSIALLMTVGVYGLVAGIVKLDDAGIALSRGEGGSGLATFKRACGRAILIAAPWLMKTLSVAGTVAMFLVGGGILVHGVPVVDHAIERGLQHGGAFVTAIGPLAADLSAGLLVGAAAVLVVQLYKWVRARSWRARPPTRRP